VLFVSLYLRGRLEEALGTAQVIHLSVSMEFSWEFTTLTASCRFLYRRYYQALETPKKW